MVLRAACPPDLRVGMTIGYRPDPANELVPDLVVVRRSDAHGARLEGTPLLAVEVASPSTSRYDRVLKRQVYEARGVPSYWLLDPHTLDHGPRARGRPLRAGRRRHRCRAADRAAPVPGNADPRRLRGSMTSLPSPRSLHRSECKGATDGCGGESDVERSDHPAKVVREALGIEVGDEIVFGVEGQRAVLARVPDFLTLAGTLPVPAARRNATWDGVIRRTRAARSKSRR